MLHSISSAASVAFNVSSRPEYLPLLHNICMLHALLRLRRDMYTHAWTEDYIWTHTNLVVCVKTGPLSLLLSPPSLLCPPAKSWCGAHVRRTYACSLPSCDFSNIRMR